MQIDDLVSLSKPLKGDVTLGKISERLHDSRILFDIMKKFEVEQAGANKPAYAPKLGPGGKENLKQIRRGAHSSELMTFDVR